jgi:SAM-dependent methyltransferase
MDSLLREISENMMSRYSERYKKLGYDVKTLGWGSKEQQTKRFDQVLKTGISIQDKTLLDIGCGFGDLAKHLLDNSIRFKSYLGWDLNHDLIDEARTIWKTIEIVNFDVQDISRVETNIPVANIGVMLGVLNLNLKNKIDNYVYAETLIRNAFQRVDRCLVVDFLSARLDDSYPREDFVFYYDPSKIVNIISSMSDNWTVHHNYAPIPQKEFMVTIYK